MKLANFGLAILIAPLLLGCQSSEKKTLMLPDRDDHSTAEGAAYTADSMNFRKEMPSHADWSPTPFYYKHCSEVGERAYYSKTSYECSSAP